MTTDRKSPVIKRSIKLFGRPTSVCLEQAFWEEVQEIAKRGKYTVREYVESVSKKRVGFVGLATALRLTVLADLKARVVPQQQAAE